MLSGAPGFLAQEHGVEAAAESAAHTPAPPAELLFHVVGLPVTNTILTAWVVTLPAAGSVAALTWVVLHVVGLG